MGKGNVFLKWVLCGAALMFAVGCGVIPGSYRGEFVDAKTGSKMELQAKGGVFHDSSGRVMESAAQDLSFDQLVRGESGIFVETTAVNQSVLSLYWLSPDLSTRVEKAGFIWFEAEMIHTLLALDSRTPVQEFEVMHCLRGKVRLDTVEKLFQMDCSADISQSLHMVRLSE